ncbi:hypothetical protein [Pseudothauera rhizosphaerae]|uniref:Uncharacterized protein n=1 Tax=Pseudothauera rhizosphaerae TaxID=2565932 RepID=A0A4S4AEW0_9RHOO|nr:hypothetical protein [Pseudothauera rhizosphaerae]THF57281.1 hypothetical protein E6O51_18465 [Pseudothauera rhizosphaerae]
MSTSPEEQSVKIVAEAEALLKKAQESIDDSYAAMRAAGMEPEAFAKSVDEMLDGLPSDKREELIRQGKEAAEADLADLKHLAVPTSTTVKPKNAHRMI